MKSDLSTYSKYVNNNCNVRTEKITKITIHHCACVGASAESIAKNLAVPRRCASANYIIGKDGEIICAVGEEKRSWCSGNRENDQKAITIEVVNSSGKPNWEISDICMKSLIALCTDICKRYNITPYFNGTKNGSFTFHYMFQATECPGNYIKKNINNIIDAVKKNLSTTVEKPVDKPKEETPASNKEFKVKVTCNDLNIRAGAGTKYKVVGHIKDKGVYTIVEVSGNWGKLKSGAGWVSLRYTKTI